MVNNWKVGDSVSAYVKHLDKWIDGVVAETTPHAIKVTLPVYVGLENHWFYPDNLKPIGVQKDPLYTPDGIIRTVSGTYINVFDPKPEHILIGDIAHALSHHCRFGGHLRLFYTVAQHCIACANRVADEHKLAALLHDASEAYLLDIPSPIKGRLANYKEIEGNLMRVISKKFGFQFPLSDEVKAVDAKMLEWEWDSLVIAAQYSVAHVMSPLEARLTFLKLFDELSRK